MRREPTKAEAAFWKLLRILNDEGANFRRQIAVDNYVFDFGDYSARVLIEVDGNVHDQTYQQQADEAKERYAREQGFRLMRVGNEEVEGDVEALMARVRTFHGGLRSESPPPPTPPRKGEGEG